MMTAKWQDCVVVGVEEEVTRRVVVIALSDRRSSDHLAASL
jgi:hypothetical protein